MSVKVKICGITSASDALDAVEAGADMLGFMFHELSPRHISPDAAASIIHQLPPFVVKVGVFVNAPTELVWRLVSECGLNLLQFHGEETPEYCLQFGVMSIKAFRIRDVQSLAELKAYPTEAWLLDAYVRDRHGGTGATFNWELAVEAGKSGRPIILAGGLTPENVGEAIRKVAPFGVDVSSGVESAPGKKDAAKIRSFIAAVRATSHGGTS